MNRMRANDWFVRSMIAPCPGTRSRVDKSCRIASNINKGCAGPLPKSRIIARCKGSTESIPAVARQARSHRMHGSRSTRGRRIERDLQVQPVDNEATDRNPCPRGRVKSEVGAIAPSDSCLASPSSNAIAVLHSGRGMVRSTTLTLVAGQSVQLVTLVRSASAAIDRWLRLRAVNPCPTKFTGVVPVRSKHLEVQPSREG